MNILENVRRAILRVSDGDPNRFTDGTFDGLDVLLASRTPPPTKEKLVVYLFPDAHGTQHICGIGSRGDLFLYGGDGWKPASDFDEELVGFQS